MKIIVLMGMIIIILNNNYCFAINLVSEIINSMEFNSKISSNTHNKEEMISPFVITNLHFQFLNHYFN